MKYELTKEMVNNLIIFLDRVALTGHKERQAMNEIIYDLSNPIEEDVEETMIKQGE